MRPRAFTGSLIREILTLGLDAQVIGGVLGFVFAQARNYLDGEASRDVVWVATRAGFTAATFVILVVLTGHAIRAVS
jgi:hypothetical protein